MAENKRSKICNFHMGHFKRPERRPLANHPYSDYMAAYTHFSDCSSSFLNTQ